MNVPQLRFKRFNKGWKETTLEQEVEFFDHKRRPVTGNLRNKGIYPYYGATGVIDYVDSYVLEGDFLLLAEDGANIITRSAPVVYKTEGKFWVNNHAHVLKPIQSNDFNFFYELLESTNYIKFNSGTAQPKLNLQNVKKIPIHIPESSEQIKIGKFFELIGKRLAKQQEKIEKLEQFKKGMMQKVFSQELRFKDEEGGEFPEWVEKSLPEIVEVIDGDRGKNYPSESDFFKEGHCLFLNTKNVTKNGFNFMNMAFITKEKHESMRKGTLKRNDIVMTSRGSIGNIVLYDYTVPFDVVRINSAMLIIRLKNESLNIDFLEQLLKSRVIKNFVDTSSVGSAQPHITVKDLNRVKVRIPSSLNEQKIIANISKKLEKKLEKEKEKLMVLEQQKKGFMQGMFV